MYNHNKAQQSKNRVHISWDILYVLVEFALHVIRARWESSHKSLEEEYWCTILVSVNFPRLLLRSQLKFHGVRLQLHDKKTSWCSSGEKMHEDILSNPRRAEI